MYQCKVYRYSDMSRQLSLFPEPTDYTAMLREIAEPIPPRPTIDKRRVSGIPGFPRGAGDELKRFWRKIYHTFDFSTYAKGEI